MTVESNSQMPPESSRHATVEMRVPVLMFHGISMSDSRVHPHREAKFWILQDVFAKQLAEIRTSGCQTALLADVWNDRKFVSQRRRPVVITFDDGHSSDYEAAFPMLEDSGMGADFFVNTATVSKPGYLTWSQIDEMHRAGMGFHSHGHDHIALTCLSYSNLRDQLTRSKQILEDKLGAAVEFFGAPYGFLNRRTIECAFEVGYKWICNSWPWPARPAAKIISRIAIHGSDDSRNFHHVILGQPRGYIARAMRAAALSWPKRILLRLSPELLSVSVLEEHRA
jgi:peptidoglycan/xylan/chitin deacetylase (PgdA/CDA1 family)